MTLIIREATTGDLPQVHDLIGLLARHHGDIPTIGMDALHRQIFVEEVGHLVVAAEEEGLVGYALLLPRPNLFVVEWRRRAGIGRALIAAAQEMAKTRGSEVLMIGTHWNNLAAQQAYRGMGLEEIAHGPRFRIALG